MLTNLKIENVAVIEKAEINFERGLNIFTGETGAGKSIVIDSINAVLGERTSKELVRDGEARAKVTAFFENISKSVLDTLNELDIDPEDDGSLLITRTLSSDGRTSCRINGQPATVSMLRTLGRELITICGQHDSQRLLEKENHIKYIDTLARLDELLSQYVVKYKEYCEKKREFSQLRKFEEDKQQRLEFLEYQINELNSAQITVGEKEELLQKKRLIENREKITGLLYKIKTLVSGDEESSGLLDGIYDLSESISLLSSYNSEFEEFSEPVENIRFILEDCAEKASEELYGLDGDEEDINSIESRLDVLYRLSRKYGETEEDMIAYLEKITDEYDRIQTSDEMQKVLSEQIDALHDEVYALAKDISKKRKSFAKKFQSDVMEELEYLDMKGALFEVRFEEKELSENGIDSAEFLISANSGQSPKPLSRIASGGELSRIMLAIRCVLSDSESVETIIFDEIDAGVSGRAAHKIAYKLRQNSADRQIICVTHLAQIAAAADSHMLIEKKSDGEKTSTSVKKLIDDERIYEIARIIGGEVITKSTLMSACELIDFANTP